MTLTTDALQWIVLILIRVGRLLDLRRERKLARLAAELFEEVSRREADLRAAVIELQRQAQRDRGRL